MANNSLSLQNYRNIDLLFITLKPIYVMDNTHKYSMLSFNG